MLTTSIYVQRPSNKYSCAWNIVQQFHQTPSIIGIIFPVSVHNAKKGICQYLVVSTSPKILNWYISTQLNNCYKCWWKSEESWIVEIREHWCFMNDYPQAGNVQWWLFHYNDVKMVAMASQITSLTIVYSTVYSGTNQRKHQSSASLAFVRGIHRWPVNSPYKWPVTRKMFPFDALNSFDTIRGPRWFCQWSRGSCNLQCNLLPHTLHFRDKRLAKTFSVIICLLYFVKIASEPSLQFRVLPFYLYLGN